MVGADRPVHPALRAVLARPMTGYDLRLDTRAVHFGLPSVSATVIIALDEPLDTAWAASPDDSARYWRLVAGLHTRPSLVRTHGRQCGIQLALTPIGVRIVFGVRVGELAGALVDGTELPATLSATLHERLADTPTWDARFDLVEAWLRSRVADTDGRRDAAPAAELARAWALLARPGARVDAVAREVGWTRRTLSARFGAEFGLSPKRFAGLARFDRSLRLARAGVPLAEAAARAGYVDQSHLSNAWRGYAGRPPHPTLDDVFPNVHDVVAAHPEPSIA